MIGILIATHGDFAQGLLSAVELLAGKQEQVETIGLHHEDSIVEFEAKVNAALDTLDTGDGVIVFVDILGGSPSNVILRSLGRKKFYAFADVNMAMLIQAVMMREMCGIEELYEMILEVSKKEAHRLHEIAAESMEAEDGEEDEF